MRQLLRRLLGRNGQAIILHFANGPEDHVLAMIQEIRSLEPNREHLVVCIGQAIDGLPCLTVRGGSLGRMRSELRTQLAGRRIGLAPFLLGGDWRLPALMAPGKLLAYNARGERHHLRLTTPIASFLFARGVPLDRIWLRPRWWPMAKERSRASQNSITLHGRPLRDGYPRIAVVSPYFPWPLSHGGAVRIYNMLREAAKEFDLFLYCFAEAGAEQDSAPVMEWAHQAVLFEMPRYREPKWASLEPPEVREFRSPALLGRLRSDRKKFGFGLIQAEYTQLAGYDADVLVEHDVTYDLCQQVHEQEGRLITWWNLWRWRRFEERAVRTARRVVAMAEKDAALLGSSHVRVLPNGVDLARFTPTPEADGVQLLFIGSFRHFPNILAFRFFHEQVWPKVKAEIPGVEWTVVAGPEPELYWRSSTDAAWPREETGIRLLGFVRDVTPLYRECNLVLSPTQVSAGTNLKVLEAMAMERAVVSTPSGCAGLNLVHGESVAVGSTAEEFARLVIELLRDGAQRRRLAASARAVALEQFDWSSIGKRQAELWRELLGE